MRKLKSIILCFFLQNILYVYPLAASTANPATQSTWATGDPSLNEPLTERQKKDATTWDDQPQTIIKLTSDQLHNNDQLSKSMAEQTKQTMLNQIAAKSDLKPEDQKKVQLEVVGQTKIELANTKDKLVQATAEVDKQQDLINKAKENSTTPNADSVNKSVQDTTSHKKDAGDILANVFKDVGVFLKNLGNIIADTFKIIGKIITIVLEKIGKEILKIAIEIGKALAKAAEEIFKVIVTIVHELENIVKAIANFFSNLCDAIDALFETPKYYVNGIRVPKEIYNASKDWATKHATFSKIEDLYLNLQTICSAEFSFAYNLNIIRVKNILTGTGPDDLPAIFGIISATNLEAARQKSIATINQKSQELQSQNASSGSQNISTSSPIPSPTLQELQTEFQLSDALTFLDNFKKELHYDDMYLMFDGSNKSNSIEISKINPWGNQPFYLGTAFLLKKYPTDTIWKTPPADALNNVELVYVNKDMFKKIISPDIENHLKKLREINAKIDQYRTMALKKQYIDKQFAWLSMIQNNLQAILFTSEQTKIKNKKLIEAGKTPDTSGIFSDSLTKIINKAYSDLQIGFSSLAQHPSGIVNSINWLYDTIMKLSQNIPPFIIHLIDINLLTQKKKAGISSQSQLEKILQSPDAQPLMLQTDPKMRFLKAHSAWKPNLQIALDLFDYMNNTLLSDKTIDTHVASALKKDSSFSLASAQLTNAEEAVVASILGELVNTVDLIQTVINLIITNTTLWAAAFGYETVVQGLLVFNPDINTPLIASKTSIPNSSTIAAGSSVAAQPFNIALFTNLQTGLDNIKNFLMYQNFTLHLYGHTPLTAALASSNTPTTQSTQPVINKKPTPALNTYQDIIDYAASLSKTYIKPIILQAGSVSPFYPNGNPSMVALLLKNGARVDVPTMCTVFGDETAQVARFITACAVTPPAANTPLFATPLQWAIGMHNPDTAILLLNYGASLQETGGVKPLITILDPQFIQPHYPQLIQALINRGADDLTEALVNLFDGDFLQKNFTIHKNIIIPIISLLIKSGASKKPIDSKNNAIPLIATLIDHVANGKLNIQDAFTLITLLISEGIDYNVPDIHGATALMKAANNGYAQDTDADGEPTNIVKLLIQSGAGTSLVDLQGKNALDYALAGKNLFVIPYLAQGNIKLTQQARLELNKMLLDVTQKTIKPTINDSNFKLLLILLNVRFVDDKTPLSASTFHTLASPNTVDIDPNKTSPLTYATKKNNDTVVRLLLEAGANPNYKDISGNTALSFATPGSLVESLLKKALYFSEKLNNAIKVNDHTTFQSLIYQGACVNATDNDGMSALMLSLSLGRKDMVETLLNSGTNLNICDKDGKTPLMYAIDMGDLSIIQEVGETYPFGLYQKNTAGNDALAYAQVTKNQEIITYLKTLDQILQKAKSSTDDTLQTQYAALQTFYVTPQDNKHLASLSTQTNANVSQLLAAAQSNNLDQVKKLVLAINDLKLRTKYINSVDSNDNTALLWASMNNNLDMATFLIDHGADITHQNKTTNDQALTIAMRNNDPGVPLVKYFMTKLMIQKTYSNPLNQGTFDVDNVSPLLIAASNNTKPMTDIAITLFQKSTFRSQLDNLKNTVAIYGALNNNLVLLQSIENILKSPTDTRALFEQTNLLGFSPLGYALHNNNIDCVLYFMNKGVSIDALSAIIFLQKLNAVAPSLVSGFADSLNQGLPLDPTGVTAALNKTNTAQSIGTWNNTLVQEFLDKLSSMTTYTISQKLFSKLDTNVQNVLTAQGIAPSTTTSYHFITKDNNQSLLHKRIFNSPLHVHI